MLLAGGGSDVLSQLDRFKESFLWAAAKGGRVEECESLLQMGTDVNWVSPKGDTPLLAACRNGHVPVALCLLNNGAEVNLVAEDGQTALHLSCRQGNEPVSEALVQRGADIFARDENGATAFESQGPHAPPGMLRRLNIIAQRRRNQNGIGTNSTSDGAPFRFEGSLSVAEMPRALTSGMRPGSNDCRTGRANSGSRQHPTDNPDGAGGVRDGVSPRDRSLRENGNYNPGVFGGGEHRTRRIRATRGGQGDDHDSEGGVEAPQSGRPQAEAISSRGDRSRSILDFVSNGVDPRSTNSGELIHEHGLSSERVSSRKNDRSAGRQSSSFSQGEETSSRDGFESSGDEDADANDDDDEIFEEETSVRLRGGVHRGPTIRQRRLPAGQYQGDDNSPETMRLLSSGDPVPHASTAIAAAIASIADSPAPDGSSAYSATSDTLVSPPLAFDAVLWDGTGPDGGGGHGYSNCQGVGDRGGGNARTASFSVAQALPASNARLLMHLTESSGVAPSTGTERGRGEQRTGGFGAENSSSYPALGSRDYTEDVTGTRCSGLSLLAEEGNTTNDHVGLIRILWLQEKESRLAAEAKADAVRDQSARLWNELVRSEKQVLTLEEAMSAVRGDRDGLRATLKGEGFKGRSLQELELLEKDLRKALEGVCGERDRIVQEQLAKEEQRLCVVCQENERSVLLLPCRHLCVCRGCSERQELSSCPLCRDSIVESLIVYS